LNLSLALLFLASATKSIASLPAFTTRSIGDMSLVKRPLKVLEALPKPAAEPA
jgi:hypothetical protein